MEIKRIKTRVLGHSYVSVNDLPHWQLKDLLRLMDSADRYYLQNFSKKFFSFTARTKNELINTIYPQLLSQDLENLEEFRFYFLQGRDIDIIQPEERDYDSLLGEVFLHPHFCGAHDFILKNTPPATRKIALFTTCAATKPYPYSPNFMKVFNFLNEQFGVNQVQKELHWLVISNASAPVPAEFHWSFPFYAYESNIQRYDRKTRDKYEEIVIERMNQFFDHFNGYDEYIGLLRPGSHWEHLVKKVIPDLTTVPLEKTAKKIKQRNLGLWTHHGLTQMEVFSELKEMLTEYGLKPVNLK